MTVKNKILGGLAVLAVAGGITGCETTGSQEMNWLGWSMGVMANNPNLKPIQRINASATSQFLYNEGDRKAIEEAAQIQAEAINNNNQVIENSREDARRINAVPRGIPQFREYPGSDLKINAITFCAVPSERIVIINKKYLKRGDYINDLQIYEINPKDVILNHKGDKYKLEF